jgi:hypothetical protein
MKSERVIGLVREVRPWGGGCPQGLSPIPHFGLVCSQDIANIDLERSSCHVVGTAAVTVMSLVTSDNHGR